MKVVINNTAFALNLTKVKNLHRHLREMRKVNLSTIWVAVDQDGSMFMYDEQPHHSVIDESWALNSNARFPAYAVATCKSITEAEFHNACAQFEIDALMTDCMNYIKEQATKGIYA